MAAKQFWQKNLWWLLPGWSLFSLIYRPGWSVFGAGLLFWVLLLYFSAPGIFWNYLAHLIPDPEKSKAFFQKALDAGAVIPQPYFSLGILLCRQKKWQEALDRKSTRLNSSHVRTSYAVFSLKKKTCLPRPRRSS